MSPTRAADAMKVDHLRLRHAGQPGRVDTRSCRNAGRLSSSAASQDELSAPVVTTGWEAWRSCCAMGDPPRPTEPATRRRSRGADRVGHHMHRDTRTADRSTDRSPVSRLRPAMGARLAQSRRPGRGSQEQDARDHRPLMPLAARAIGAMRVRLGQVRATVPCEQGTLKSRRRRTRPPQRVAPPI